MVIRSTQCLGRGKLKPTLCEKLHFIFQVSHNLRCRSLILFMLRSSPNPSLVKSCPSTLLRGLTIGGWFPKPNVAHIVVCPYRSCIDTLRVTSHMTIVQAKERESESIDYTVLPGIIMERYRDSQQAATIFRALLSTPKTRHFNNPAVYNPGTEN